MQNPNYGPPGGYPTIPGQAAYPPGYSAMAGFMPPSYNYPGVPGTSTTLQQTQQQSSTASGTTSNWVEYKSPDGRPYYYNTATNQTCWEKPDELKSEAEKLLATCPWKEYKTEDGKIYYHNVITKASAWTIPPELEDLKKRIDNKQQSQPQPSTTMLQQPEHETAASSQMLPQSQEQG